MKRTLLATIFAAAFTGGAQATDWIVDATGATSVYTRIDQAMALVTPGDRILVKPGAYPPFQFTHGVEVIGLGTDPSQVLIERVDYHVSIPNIGYDTGLENLSVCNFEPDNGHGISGNELPHGTLAMSSVISCGGIFLHGDGGFYLLMDNCRIETDPGEGFMNAAIDFGGGTADIVDTRIVAAPASSSEGTPAGVALRIGGNSTVRVSGSHLTGGAGEPGSSGIYRHGGHGVDVGFGSGAVNLRLAGQSQVRGGNASGTGFGGAGVRLVGAIQVGVATVAGGAGSPAGSDYALGTPTRLGIDPHLSVRPGRAFAANDAFLRPGDVLLLRADASIATAAPKLGFALRLDPPTSPLAQTPLVAPGFHIGAELRLMVPYAQQPSLDLPLGKRVYYQAFFTDPSSGNVLTSNPVSVTIDP
ncbi:MAG: hypothetical protein ACKVWV_00720 [Planctomycetota bacterium]